MRKEKKTITEKRHYNVRNVTDAKKIALIWIAKADLDKALDFGLPEVDDRHHVWRIALLSRHSGMPVGEVVIDARTSLIQSDKTTNPSILEARILGREKNNSKKSIRKKKKPSKSIGFSDIRNTIAQGDSEEILQTLPAEGVDLAFTSPPYYNARREYADYISYDDYLFKMRKVIRLVHHVLAEGRFFVMNVSPILIRRADRSSSSHRIAVPFDIHGIFIEEGFDFIDDLIWVKPTGAGWATGRGRRFAADRNPLQYKAVPITEYVLVYRKHTDRLIDWNIRSHPDQDLVKASKIGNDYERTNIWKIKPTHDKRHPAVFPLELAEKVIRYYSFSKDVVLDPFAGIGTTGKAATKLGRRFVLIEREKKYVDIMREDAKKWMGKKAKSILTINCPSINVDDRLV